MDTDTSAEMFFINRHAALALYRVLLLRMRELPPFEIEIKKTQISFFNRRMFACVSLPKGRGDTGLVVSFGLGRGLESPRVISSAQPYPGRYTHHIALRDGGNVDSVLKHTVQIRTRPNSLNWRASAFSSVDVAPLRRPPRP